MSIDYTKGDLLPAYEDVLLGGQSPYDLSGCTVRFVAKNQSTGAELFDRGAVVVDAPGGRVRYEPAAGDTDTVGRFLAQWVVTTSEGKRRTFPTDFLLFQVHESADADASGGAPPATVSSVSVYGWAKRRRSSDTPLTGLPSGAAAGDIELLTGQDDPTEDGLWVVSDGAWARPANGNLFPGALVYVVSERSYWMLDADEVPAVDADPQVWRVVFPESRLGATITGSGVITVESSVYRVVLAGNATITLSTTSAMPGQRIELMRDDVTSYTATLVNGGAGAGTLLVMPGYKRWWAAAYFDGTNWFLGPSMEQQ